MTFKYIFVCFIIIQASFIHAQDSIYVYYTYNDYKDNKGEKMNEYMGISGVSVSLNFKKGQENVKLKCKDFWGFDYNGRLFRNDMITGLPCYVFKTGKCIFYANGPAHLDMTKEKTNSSTFNIGYYYYISNNLNSEICPMQVVTQDYVKPTHTAAKKRFRKFKEANPQHKNFYDCLNDRIFIYFVEKCMEQY